MYVCIKNYLLHTSMCILPPDSAYPPTNLLLYSKQWIRLVHDVTRKTSQKLERGNAEARFWSCHSSLQNSLGSTHWRKNYTLLPSAMHRNNIVKLSSSQVPHPLSVQQPAFPWLYVQPQTANLYSCIASFQLPLVYSQCNCHPSSNYTI